MLGTKHTEQLTQIARNLFNMPSLQLTDDLTAKDVLGWDSFNYINLIINIEEEFRVKFTNEEVSSLKNAGELKILLAKKIS